METKSTEAKAPKPAANKTVFIKIDALNNTKFAKGSINSQKYSFDRGKTVKVSATLAMHLVTVDQAIEV